MNPEVPEMNTKRKKGRAVRAVKPGPAGSRERIRVRRVTQRGLERSPSVRRVERPGVRKKKVSVKRPVRAAGKRKLKREVPRKEVTKKPGEQKGIDFSWMEEDPKDHLFSRFIYDSNSKVIGESIGVEGRQLIMKSGKKFYSVPLKNIADEDEKLTLKGKIDRLKARRLGEAWRKRALDPLYNKKKK